MGYRSTIYIKFKAKDEKEFLDILKKHDLQDAFELQTLHTPPDEYRRYIGNDFKWYEGYKEIDEINKWISKSDLDKDRPRALIAVGEDNATTFWGEPYDIDMYESVTVDW